MPDTVEGSEDTEMESQNSCSRLEALIQGLMGTVIKVSLKTVGVRAGVLDFAWKLGEVSDQDDGDTDGEEEV